MYLAPYSYDMAPCELLFARLKTRDLSLSMIKAGKKVSTSLILYLLSSRTLPTSCMQWSRALLKSRSLS